MKRSLIALIGGFLVGGVVTIAFSLFLNAVGLVPDEFVPADHPLTSFIARPDWFSAIVALMAGAVGVLSLTNPKSSALIGVLISVTTVPGGGLRGADQRPRRMERGRRRRGAAGDQHRGDRGRRRGDPGNPAQRLPPAAGAPPARGQVESVRLTRSITASVNSVVDACPPRSGVLTPSSTVSSTAA